MSIRNPSIAFFVASTGRSTLTNLLRSLYGQFNHGVDHIYVFFDGICEAGLDYFNSEKELYGNDITFNLLPENLGYWGHGIRNKYQTSFKEDYIMNCDDDDAFVGNVFPQVRQDLKENYGKILIYKIQADGGSIWNRPIIEHGQIATPMGLIFNRPEIFGHWGEGYGGDYSFYNDVQNNIGIENIVFKPTYIYVTKPHIKGWR